MKHIQKIAFALVLSCAIASGQDTNFSTRLACELQTAGPASLADLTWQQGTTPHIAVAPLRMGRPVAVDALTTVRMIIGQSGIVTNYALATNWLATNSTYYVQWPTIGTNSAWTNTAAQAWWYTVHFERDGRRYWTGDGRLYIEPTTSTAEDGLVWQEITAGAATDLVARAQIAALSNEVAGIEAGEVVYGVATNTAYRGDMGLASSNLAASAYAAVSNIPPAGSWRVWVDAATNYYAADLAGTKFTNASFSATMNWVISNAPGQVSIRLGQHARATNSTVPYFIDGPITIRNDGGRFIGFALRGEGNYGTTISVAEDYAGEMFVLGGTQAIGICRFEDIRFQAGSDNGVSYASANTNTVINSILCSELCIDKCEFDGFKGSAIRHGEGITGLSGYNYITESWFVGLYNQHPHIVLSTPTNKIIAGFPIMNCQFMNTTTNPAISFSGNVLFAKISGCLFNAGTVSGERGIYITGNNYGHSINNNSFTFFEGADCPIEFQNDASNYYDTVISGNVLGRWGCTNAVVVGTNAHGVSIVGNSYGAATRRILGDNSGGYILEGYGSTSDTAARGDWFSGTSNSAAAAYGWGNHATNGYLTEESDPMWEAWVGGGSAGTTNAIDADGTLVDISALLGGGAAADGGWTNLAFAGTGNAITSATATGATLTLERGTIEGGTGTANETALIDPYVLTGTNVMFDATNNWLQSWVATSAASQISFAIKTNAAQAIGGMLYIQATTMPILWITNSPPVTKVGNVPSNAVSAWRIESLVGATNYIAERVR